MEVSTKVIYSLSGGASIFFALWQQSGWAGAFMWSALVCLWEMVTYLVDSKQ